MTAAKLIIMANILRKVAFTLGSYEFIPNPTPKEKDEMEEITKKRTGYFHRWVDDIDTSKDIPYIKTEALVEDIEDGKLYTVVPDLITFLNDEV